MSYQSETSSPLERVITARYYISPTSWRLRGVATLLTLMIWSTAQGFGGPYGPGSTDIGVGIIYTLVFCGLFLACAGISYGLDRHLATKLGRWSFLASGPVRKGKHLSLPLFYVPVS